MNRKLLIIAVLISSLFGLLMIYSASFVWAEYKYNDPYKYLKMQAIFLVIGYFIMYLVSKIDYKFYQKYANIILLITTILLGLVLIPGIGKVRNGSRSWFGLGPFGLQPSELAKLALIIFTSKYLSKNENIVKNIKKGIFPILMVIVFIFGLIMLEPDFGQGFVMVLTLLILIFISGTPISFFNKFIILGISGIVSLIIMAPYRLKRIISFINPWSDPLGAGFQIIQSLYAIAPSGLLGLGFGNSIQKRFYLPEPQTDFIFAIIMEEFGFLGAIIVLSLFVIIFITSMKIALKAKTLFAKYLAFGLGIEIIIQAILNLAVVTGLIPVTGVTLPFYSYGGSSLLITLISIGIILSIEKKEK